MFFFIESGLLDITGLPIVFARVLRPHRGPFSGDRPVLRYYKSVPGGTNPMINPDRTGARSVTDDTPKSLCVFTPTYNRAYCLEDLYQSLVAQTCQDFHWLIVDDGSTDQTRSLVEDMSARGEISMSYLRQENGGKQRAWNTGAQACDQELFFCVDSDDTLVPDAVEAILSRWKGVSDDTRIAGIVGLDGTAPDKPLGTWMPKNRDRTTIWDLYYKSGHKGDVAVIYRTDVLRRYPFVVAEGEKFVAETYVYFLIDDNYELTTLDKVLILADYRADGYSSNARRVTRENPQGYIRLKRMHIERADTFTLKLKASILYLVGYHFSNESMFEGIKAAPSPAIATIAAPFAWVLAKTEFQK